MSVTRKTSAENLTDLLDMVADIGAEWREVRAAGEDVPEALRAAYIAAIGNYASAEQEHEDQSAILRQIEGDRVWTMEEIEQAPVLETRDED